MVSECVQTDVRMGSVGIELVRMRIVWMRIMRIDIRMRICCEDEMHCDSQEWGKLLADWLIS